MDITPSPHRLLMSLRDVGYDFVTAIADLVDNAIAANARKISIEISHADGPPHVLIADDGHGMTAHRLADAMRLGSERNYRSNDLGKFGLGLKTASLSQCRRLVVLSRQSKKHCRIARGMLDLDRVAVSNRWRLASPPSDPVGEKALGLLRSGPGTVVILQKLDRIISSGDEIGGWDRRRLDRFREATAKHLSMVFHRFLESKSRTSSLRIFINGKRIRAWNPFALDETHTRTMPEHRLEFSDEQTQGEIRVQGHILPPRDLFSSVEAFESLSGPQKWNRQQGFYIYRNDRLIQSGGWSGMRAADEHTKLARIAVDFTSPLDEIFNVNIAKMRVAIPPQIRLLLERVVLDVVKKAQAAYRRPLKVVGASPSRMTEFVKKPPSSQSFPIHGELMLALKAAALAAGESDSLARILKQLKRDEPELAVAAGLAVNAGGTSKQHRPASHVG